MAEGEAETNWYDTIPAELKEAPFFRPGEDGAQRPLEQVLSDINNAASHMGNSLRMPGPDATPEQVQEFTLRAAEKFPDLMPKPKYDDDVQMNALYNSLGRPETPESYELPAIEGVDWSTREMGAAKAEAHSLGMTQKQFSQMLANQHEATSRAQEESARLMGEEMDALRGEWGEAFGPRLDKVAGLLAKTGAPEYLQELVRSGKMPPTDLRWVYSMADAMGAEGQELQNLGKDGQPVMAPDEALDQLREIENNPALWNAADPDHARLVAKRVELVKKANPEADTSIDRLRA